MFVKDPTAPHMHSCTTCETLMLESERLLQTNAVIIPAKASLRGDYVITGVRLSVRLSVCLFVCYHDS